MKYTPSEIEVLFQKVLDEVEKGKPLRQILGSNGMPSRRKFYDWIDSDESMRERYARAKDVEADALFDEMLTIAKTPIETELIDDGPNGVRRVTSDNVQRSRLMVDALKWVLAKKAPKKYGDKIDVTSDNQALALPAIVGMVIKNEIKADGPSEDYDDLL